MINLDYIFTAHLELEPWLSYGESTFGNRRFVAVKGGSIRGPRINGEIISGGGDWPLVNEGGILRFDARWSFRTDEGALVYVQNPGIRRSSLDVHDRLDRHESVDAESVYFRTTPSFETGAGAYLWLTQSVFVATGRRGPHALELEVYEVK